MVERATAWTVTGVALLAAALGVSACGPPPMTLGTTQVRTLPGQGKATAPSRTVGAMASPTAAGPTSVVPTYGRMRGVPHGADPASTAAKQALQRLYSQPLKWQACPPLQNGKSVNPQLKAQCAWVEVPLDYAKPEGKTIKLLTAKVPATDQANRLGTIFFNPGGPGGSGVDSLLNGIPVSAEAAKRFDVVGFDPRGIGKSAPVTCGDHPSAPINTWPRNEREVRRLVRDSKGYARECGKLSGAMLPYVGTVNVAKDLDLLRSVFGDVKLTYLGQSYGTRIGALYLERFGPQTGRMVLDGMDNPGENPVESRLGQVKGFEGVFRTYLRWCANQPGCATGKDPEEGYNRVVRMVGNLRDHLLPAQSGRKLGVSDAVIGIIATLYSRNSWPILNRALTNMSKGDGVVMLRLADLYAGRDFQTGRPKNNSGAASVAVTCADDAGLKSLAEVRAAVERFKKVSPLFGEQTAWGLLQCGVWPYQTTQRPEPVNAPGAPPTVIVSFTNDPTTPISNARSVHDMLAGSSLVTRQGEGHIAYATGDFCVNRAVDNYLIAGRQPAEQTTC
ncbi:alpha/beta hydrolase [Sinosporangium siamense]|uniref:Proteinase n=1 Tax=Sinosporangium siamense TaxID=1367973 RepID=A0A919RM73_9ACTN|nr:alpha/beta hydrolase [Sinosporangium siamense]GII95405.1 proteinase [Sinosporangium siamense]